MQLYDTKPSEVNDDAWTLTARLLRFFEQRPDTWIDGKQLAGVAGSYGWRTRVSDLRKAPYHKQIRNRVRRVHTPAGTTFVISEYRLVTGDGVPHGDGR